MKQRKFLFAVEAIALLLLLIFFTFANCSGDNKTENIGQQQNLLKELQSKWLIKAVIPVYLQAFLKLSPFQKSQNLTEPKVENDNKAGLFFDTLFNGVGSKSCKVQVTEWFWRVNFDTKMLSSEENKWVLQIPDSWGKLPEGLLSGHVNAYGDFDECVQIRVENLDIRNSMYSEESRSNKNWREFKGQYCTVQIKDYASAMKITPNQIGNATDYQKNVPAIKKVNEGAGRVREIVESPSLEEFLDILQGKTSLIWPLAPSVAVCMPNTCSKRDVQQILVNGLNIVYKNNGENIDTTLLPWPVTEQCTDMNKPPLGIGAVIVIILIPTIATLSLTTGVIDYWQQNMPAENTTATKISNSKISSVLKYLMAFSLYTNLSKWLSTKKTADDLGCLHGIRFLSTAWIVLEHACGIFLQGPQWNLISLNNIYKDWTTLTVANGTFSVDTFFLMSGALVTYNILKMLDKSKGKFDLIMFYVHRYVRISPAHFIILGIAATLIPYTGNGPQWHIWNTNTENCQQRWWVTFLYINNLVRADQMCNDDSWYLANDMQFYILSPFIVYPIWKWKARGLITLGVYTILSCIAPAVVLYIHPNNPPAMTLHHTTHNEIYHRPWSRINTFLAGVWLGHLLHKTREKRVNISRPLNLALWLLSAGTALSIIFGIFPWFNPAYKIPKVSGYVYAGLSRFLWGVSISWVIFACVKGYGGVVNKFLSWKVFMPLGRLSFCVYLLNYHLESVFHLRLSVPIKWDLYTVINLFFGHMLMAYLLGAVCTLLFEAPFITLHKLIFDREGGKREVQKGSDNNLLADIEMSARVKNTEASADKYI